MEDNNTNVAESVTSKSVLEDVAKFLGFADGYAPFADMLCMHINSEISNLIQMGVIDPEMSTTEIVDNTTTWADILEDEHKLSMAKTYIEIGVRLVFDPPTSSAILDSLTKRKDEAGWRAKTAVETP